MILLLNTERGELDYETIQGLVHVYTEILSRAVDLKITSQIQIKFLFLNIRW